tara:strand:- start:5576 stop:6637 length:1062 start_codon:yes stop_codon:yes gene_type:complete
MKSMDPELIRKFFDGKCSPEEVHQVLIWINSEEGAKDLQEKFEKFEPTNKKVSINSQSVLDKIHDRIELEEIESLSAKENKVRNIPSKKRTKNTLLKRWKLGIAMSFLLTVMASAVWLFSNRRQEKLLTLDKKNQIEYLTKQTQAGEKLTLKLNDGSIIQLNSNTTIRFPKHFEGNTREIYMEGQAFFDVHRDENKPFIVHSKDLITSVLGTSFAILEDAATQVSQVAVLTGKVKVSMSLESDLEEADDLYLEPMDAASFNGVQGSFERIKVDYDNAFAWKDNVIVFQNATFIEVLKKLENWYGVNFQLKSSFKAHKDYSGRFDDQTLEEILIGLSFTYDFEYEIKNDTIIIH